jgi:hypothetical protein
VVVRNPIDRAREGRDRFEGSASRADFSRSGRNGSWSGRLGLVFPIGKDRQSTAITRLRPPSLAA